MITFEQVVPGIWLLKTPFSIVWSGIVLLRGEKNILIDSGAEDPDVYLIPALDQLGMKPTDIDLLLDTHCHGDHIGGHFALVERYGIKVGVIDKGEDQLLHPAENAIRIRTKFPENSPKPQSWLKGVKADFVYKENETVLGRLFPIHTPGHESDCVCWYDIPTKTIITGDSLQANGTPTQGIGFYQSLSAYEKTLEKLKTYDIENIVCAHDYDKIGSVIIGKDNVKKALEICQQYVCLYRTEINKAKDEGKNDPVEIALDLIRDYGCGMPQQLFLALYTVTQHLEEIK